MSDIFIPIVFLLTTAAVICFLHVRYKERALMIEKGIAEFKPDNVEPQLPCFKTLKKCSVVLAILKKLLNFVYS